MGQPLTGAPAVRSAVCRDASGNACSACTPRIIGWSFAANVISPVIKGMVGILCGSQALLADTLHSLSDSVSFGINYYGSRDGRITPLAQSVLIGTITFVAGVWVYAENVAILIAGERTRPGLLGPVVAGAFALLNLWLYSISACAHRRFNTTGTLLCMMQNRANCFASVLAFIGMVLADLGLTWADPICAVLIGFSLFTTAFEMFREAFAGLPPAATRGRKRIVYAVVALLSLGAAALAIDTVSRRNDVILVPSIGGTLDSPVDELLGRAAHFTVVNTDERTVMPIDNGFRHYPGDVSAPFLKIARSRHVDVVLAKKVGQEMFDDLHAAGVRVFYVHGTMTVRQALAGYRAGQFELATSPNVGGGFGREKVRWLAPW